MPENDRFLGVARTDGIVVIQVTFSAGRSIDQQRLLYRRIADHLAEAGVRRKDVWVNLVEVPRENWSFGNGIASYAP